MCCGLDEGVQRRGCLSASSSSDTSSLLAGSIVNRKPEKSPAHAPSSYLGRFVQGTRLGLKTQGCQDSAQYWMPCPALPCPAPPRDMFAALEIGVQIEIAGESPLPAATMVRPKQTVPFSGLTPYSPPMVASSSRRGTSQKGGVIQTTMDRAV